MDSFLLFATNVTYEAGKILIKYWGNLSDIRNKGYHWDLVTEADKESEKYIREKIADRFPSHSILGEESGWRQRENSKYLWIIDPLDGTTNYTHQYPMVAISIALMRENHPVLGIIYNPISGEFFAAQKDGGAFLNKVKINVSRIEELPSCLLATGFAYDRRETQDNNYSEFCHMTDLCQGVRRGGSAALDLAYVACGRLDGFWERGLKPWDIAAGQILIEEAGGKVTSYEGDPLLLTAGRILASNGLIHDKMIRELKKAKND